MATPPGLFPQHLAPARGFYLDLRPTDTAPLTVVCGGLEQTPRDYGMLRATFPFFGLEYVARGRGEVKLNNHLYSLAPGSLFSYGPGVAQRITGSANEPLVKYFVDFAGPGALALLQSCKLVPGRASKVFPPQTLQGIFDELIESGRQHGRHSASLCAQLLTCLALKIAGAHAPMEGADTLAFTTYQQCRQHIAQHFARLRTLEQISSECHLTSAHLCRLFQRYDRRTPYQYLLRLKIHAAAEHLAHPATLVKEAGQLVGFADPYHFSRIFKRVLGLSPAGFRRLGGNRHHPAARGNRGCPTPDRQCA